MYKLFDYEGRNIANCPVSPECFGAVGDGIHNDTASFQSALDNYNYIVCKRGATYYINNVLRIRRDTLLDLNGATIYCIVNHCFFNFRTGDNYTEYNGNGNITIKNGFIIGGNISFIHGENITLDNIHFRNCINDHFIEICACKDFKVINCSFVGMIFYETNELEYINIDSNATYRGFPHNTSTLNGFYDGSVNTNIIIENCYFKIGDDNEFNNGYDAIGVHGQASEYTGTFQNGVTIINNKIIGFTHCGLRINDMVDVTIRDNFIDTAGECIRIGDLITNDKILIAYNFLNSQSDNLIVKTQGMYSNLTIAYNAIATDSQNI